MTDDRQQRMKSDSFRLNAYIGDKARFLAGATDEEYIRNIGRDMTVSLPQQMSRKVYTLYAKLLLQQYYSEYWGAVQYGRAYSKGLAPAEHMGQKMFQQMYKEEYGHARLVWHGDGKGRLGPLLVLSLDPTNFLAGTPEEQVNVLHIFRHSGFTRWSEIIVYNHFQDRSAALQLRDFAEGRFEPWSKVLELIDEEEAEHIRHGEEWLLRIAETEDGKAMLQGDINKWFPHAMDVFGHPGITSKTMTDMLRFGIKQKTNDQAREDFLREVSPLIEQAGLHLPEWQYQESRPF